MLNKVPGDRAVVAKALGVAHMKREGAAFKLWVILSLEGSIGGSKNSIDGDPKTH